MHPLAYLITFALALLPARHELAPAPSVSAFAAASVKESIHAAALEQTGSSSITWYGRADGGTLYDPVRNPGGQCDGQGDASYPGTGTNQHCGFSEVEYLYNPSGAYRDSTKGGFAKSEWMIAGGDKVILDNTKTWRIGWRNPNSSCDAPTGRCWGIQGDAFDSMLYAPPDGPRRNTLKSSAAITRAAASISFMPTSPR